MFSLVCLTLFVVSASAYPQLHGSTVVNSDKSSAINARLPITGDDKNMLSAVGGLNFDRNKHLQAATAGLAYDNARGHGLSLTDTHIPNFGDKLTAAGHANLFHDDNHDVTANAFVTRNMPSIPQVPNFNTVGGGLDYMYKNRVGASLGVARTPLFDRTDYSATGNLNLFRDRASSLDFNAGFSKSVSPFMRSSSWEPSAGLTFRKYF
uniref:Attacin n=1 Tax=Helicoverpa armigera TaxID=29058 RepID=Q58HM7_HELAM|nr:attacin [Helicoverpa armigera]